MFNDDFDFYPDQRNMRFEKPMHGPPGRGGPPGHHMRHAGPMRRRMPDMPPNFRGPREPMYDDYIGPPPMGRGPHYGGNSPQPNFASPARNQQSPGNMPYPKSRGGPPMIPYPPPGFGSGGSNRGASESHSPSQHMQKHNSAAVSSVNLDFWVETTLQETGKTYYYHAKTRESSWVKPENVKIIRQDEIEQMAAAASATNENNNNTKNNHTQFAPFVPIGPMACTMPAPGIGMLPPAAYGMGPPPPFGIPLYPYGIPPPNFGSVPQVSSDMSQGSQPPKAIDKEDEEEWDEYTSVDGRVYYVHKISKISVWQKPPKKPNIEATERANAKDLDSVKTSEADSTNAMEVEEREVCDTQSGDIKNELVESEKSQEEGKRESDFENGSINMGGDEKTEHNSGHLSPHESVKIDEITDEKRKKNENEKITEEKKPELVDKSRPVSSTPIPGSPYFVVFTGDGKSFFYNHVTRTSVWQRPEELKGRSDVQKLLQEPPSLSPEESGAHTESSDETKSEKNDSGPETKRVKREDMDGEKEREDTKAPVKTFITHGKESAIEAELRAAKERAVIALDVRQKEFIDLLIEKEVSAFSTWEKELHKIVFDPRYLLLTSKERKTCFDRYVKDRAEEERSEKRKKAKERKDDYRKLLEEASLTAKSTFTDFAQRYAKDDRLRCIEKMRERESLFNDFVENLRRKERDERSNLREKVKKNFLELLKEKQEIVDKSKRWADVKKERALSDDYRYKAVDSSSLREEWFREYTRLSHDMEDDAVKEREKQERVEASIREREKEVQRTLSTHLRERDKERELHKHDEAVQHFKALLTDLVRSPDVSWHELKRILRKDHRSDIMGCLNREERERVFDEHISFLYRKKKEKFRELLEETPEITLTSSWKEVKKLIKDDPRCSKFSSSDRKCEKEFKEYLKDKMVAAKADFRELLKETKIITYKSRKLIEETDHLHDIEKVLQNDKRYLVLQCIEEERRTLLMSYIETLDRKGPPPPPTASEPSRRSTK